MNTDPKRRAAALVLIGAGVVWSVLFPKKASFDADMVASVALGIGLLGTGGIVLRADGRRWRTAVLSTALLWSLLANAYLIAWQNQALDLLASVGETSGEASPSSPTSDGR